MPAEWNKIASVVTPGELHFTLRFSADSPQPVFADPGASIGQAYGVIDLPDKPKITERLNGKAMADHVLRIVRSVAEGWLEFYFVPAKTIAERNTPIFPPINEMKRPAEPWPAVLESIRPRVDYHFRVGAPYIVSGLTTRGTITAPRRWMEFKMKHLATSRPCRHRTSTYVAEVPWPDGSVGLGNAPDPHEIRWNWHTEAGTTGPCLHGKHVIHGFIDQYLVLKEGTGVETVAGPTIATDVWDETSPTDWEKYEIVECSNRPNDEGQFVKVVTEVFPPSTSREGLNSRF